jgi:hypothetical protein
MTSASGDLQLEMERSDKKENAADQVIVKKECLQSTGKRVVTLSIFLFRLEILTLPPSVSVLLGITHRAYCQEDWGHHNGR